MKRLIIHFAVFFLLASCDTSPSETTIPLPTSTSTQTKTLSIKDTYKTPIHPSPTKAPPPTQTFTPYRTYTTYPKLTYRDPDYHFTMDYPAHWEQVGIREFRGVEGSLKISKLEGYSSTNLNHVRADYLYSTYHDMEEIYSNVSIDSGRFIIRWTSRSVKYLDIRSFVTSNHKLGYLLFEFESSPTLINYFSKRILSSLIFDYEEYPTATIPSPTPQPRAMTLESGVTIQEYYSGPAPFWRTLWWSRIFDTSLAYKNDPKFPENCSKKFSIGENKYEVFEEDIHNIIVKENGHQIFSFIVTGAPYPMLQRFCSWKGHWLLEFDGFIVQDGLILNHEYGFEEMFGLHFIENKLIYFFVQEGQIYISFDGEILPISYDYVKQYGCCEYGYMITLKGNDEMIWFYGVHDDAVYFVEIGLEK